MNTSTTDFSKRATRMLVSILLCLPFLCNTVHASSTTPRPFASGNLEEILATRAGKPLMLILWSMDCSNCLKELELLSETVRDNPNLDVVMISTDDAADSDQVQAILGKHQLGAIESWIFAQSNDPRLRFEIDSAWFGELPRTYFYSADHNRMALSGALEPQHFKAWLKTIGP